MNKHDLFDIINYSNGKYFNYSMNNKWRGWTKMYQLQLWLSFFTKKFKKKVDFVLLNVMIYYITNLIREIRNSTFL